MSLQPDHWCNSFKYTKWHRGSSKLLRGQFKFHLQFCCFYSDPWSADNHIECYLKYKNKCLWISCTDTNKRLRRRNVCRTGNILPVSNEIIQIHFPNRQGQAHMSLYHSTHQTHCFITRDTYTERYFRLHMLTGRNTGVVTAVGWDFCILIWEWH